MGEIDIENLMKIYRKCLQLCKEHHLPYSFRVDHGTYETAIEFIGSRSYHPPLSKNWNQSHDIFCPDLLDYEHKIIIEYEEEVGERQTGAKLATKGHHREGDMDTNRDIRRNLYYKDSKFRVLRIYESDKLWEKKLGSFLIELNDC